MDAAVVFGDRRCRHGHGRALHGDHIGEFAA
jgi:hypothetical protein